MKKWLFLLLLCSGWVQAQVQVSGKLVDTNKAPIEEATVFISKAKDSTLVTYTATDVGGNFKFGVSPIKDSVFITFSLTGYEEQKKYFPSLTEQLNLGTIIMEDESNLLSEIVIVTDVPVRVKNDTIEYNAASFKVRPDANVEALLKELPGVEIDAEKNITVNGKSVTQILVNNKPFFNRDGTVALQNLPADLIKKVQVTEKKTKTEEFSGRRGSTDEASINLTIDEENNQGLMGRIMGGYGTDERYESSGMLNYFKGDRKITVLASSNNINSSGFSMDEVFDNMSGGRSQFMSFGGRGGGRSGFGNTFFSSQDGITRTNIIGFNYADQLVDKLDSNLSYYMNDRRNENNNRSRIVNLLPDGEFITDSEENSITESTGHNASLELEYEIDKTTKVFVRPQLDYSKNRYINDNNSVSTDGEGLLFNESTNNSASEIDQTNFSNSIEFNKVLGTGGKNLSLELSHDNSKSNGLGNLRSNTIFYQGTQPDDIRDQQENTRSTDDDYSIALKYSQPIFKDAFFDFGYNFNHNKLTDVLQTYDYDATTGAYGLFNDQLSNESYTTANTSTPYAGFNIQGKNIYFRANGGVNIMDYTASANYMGNEYRVDRKFVTPYLNTQLRYSPTQMGSINAGYSLVVNEPMAQQILGYERLNDPLNTFIGNEGLDLGKNHYFNLGYRNNNVQMRSGWGIFASGSYGEKNIVASTTFDENRKRTTTYENVEDTWNVTFFANWYKSKKIDAHTIRYGVRARSTYALDKQYINGVEVTSNQIAVMPTLYANWDYGDFLTVAPSYNLEYTNRTFKNYQLDATDFVRHIFMIQTTTYWPSNWTWGNDFSYTYNSNISSDFQRDFFLWNTSIGYTFLNKTMTAKVKVYDILNQNIGVSRSVSATAIVDQENTVLRRYAMFSLTWKFDKFGNSKSNTRERRGPGGMPPGGFRRI